MATDLDAVLEAMGPAVDAALGAGNDEPSPDGETASVDDQLEGDAEPGDHDGSDGSDDDAFPDDEDTDGDSDDGEEQDDAEPTTYKVKAAGEEVEVTLDELIAGFQRNRDYTQGKQQLATERAEIEGKLADVSAWYEERVNNKSAWIAEIAEEAGDPTVITDALALMDDPTAAIADAIAGLAQAGKLSDEFLSTFYPQGAPKVDRTQRELERKIAALEARLEGESSKSAAEQAQAAQVAAYRQQWEQAKVNEGAKFDTPEAERVEKQNLLAWLEQHPGVTDLTVAYAAYRREVERKTPKAPQGDDEARKALADRKRRNGAVSRRGGRSGKPSIKSLDDAIGAALAERNAS